MHVENPKSHLLDNIAYPRDDGIGVLKTAGIYGANASGKSNILQGLSALRWLITSSDSLREHKKIVCYEPYLLAGHTRNAPISFEVEFIISGKHRYIYAISYDSTEIISESLDFYPSRQKANIFNRPAGSTWDTITFGSYYKGGVKKIPHFKNNSYLAVAGNNAAAPDIIRDVHKYFSRIIKFGLSRSFPVSSIYHNERVLNMSTDFIKSLDTGVTAISKEENHTPESLKALSPFPKHIREQILEDHKYKFLFRHKDEDGGYVNFEQEKESDGTQQLFRLFPAIISSLRLGGILIIDELESSFHPHIAELVIDLYNNPDINIYNAQLLFTTHNLQLMSPKVFRRDQIWFASKTNGASKLFSLDEFDKGTVTTSSPYGNWYGEGRFGAIPEINKSQIFSMISRMMGVEEPSTGDEEFILNEEEGLHNA
ncbi:hypothetical protein PSCICL_40040 [Pseudomonas cichorii]|nr:hypothetical protein PSCICL_40040 [Pseudomonas cichorii]